MGLGTQQGASHFISLALWYMCVNACILKPPINGKKTTTRRSLEWCGPRTRLSAHATRTHTRTHSFTRPGHTCHAHAHTQSSLLEPGSFQLYFPDPFVSCLLLSRSLLARLPRPSAPWPATAPRGPSTRCSLRRPPRPPRPPPPQPPRPLPPSPSPPRPPSRRHSQSPPRSSGSRLRSERAGGAGQDSAGCPSSLLTAPPPQQAVPGAGPRAPGCQALTAGGAAVAARARQLLAQLVCAPAFTAALVTLHLLIVAVLVTARDEDS